MKVVDLSDQIVRNLNNPSDISIPSVAAFLRFDTNLGKINNLLKTDYSIDPNSLEIVDSKGVEITPEVAGIYELLYQLNYYIRQINRYLGAGGVETNILQEGTSDGGTLRFVSRNEISKSFIQIKKDIQVQLDKLVNNFKRNSYRPLSIDGNDLVPAAYANPIPASSIIINEGSFIDNTRNGG